jgi:hypothetical protein
MLGGQWKEKEKVLMLRKEKEKILFHFFSFSPPNNFT